MKSSVNKPLVTVIVPTKNSSKTLGLCLESIKKQTYTNLEIVVVDNFSQDDTQKIAKKFGARIFEKGPERSAQVNYGVQQSQGEYIYKVDSDFVLEEDVVAECVREAQKGFDAVVVHNSPDVTVSWIAKIRKFEVDMYKYDLTHSSARFVNKKVFEKLKGFNETITAGEDYDFQNRLNKNVYSTGFVKAEAIHLGEPKKLWPHLVKYFEYGRDFRNYQAANARDSFTQLSPFRNVYLKNIKKFIRHPVLGLVFIFYSFLKFSFGGAGFLYAKFTQTKI